MYRIYVSKNIDKVSFLRSISDIDVDRVTRIASWSWMTRWCPISDEIWGQAWMTFYCNLRKSKKTFYPSYETQDENSWVTKKIMIGLNGFFSFPKSSFVISFTHILFCAGPSFLPHQQDKIKEDNSTRKEVLRRRQKPASTIRRQGSKLISKCNVWHNNIASRETIGLED